MFLFLAYWFARLCHPRKFAEHQRGVWEMQAHLRAYTGLHAWDGIRCQRVGCTATAEYPIHTVVPRG